jgi:hypothetical protein
MEKRKMYMFAILLYFPSSHSRCECVGLCVRRTRFAQRILLIIVPNRIFRRCCVVGKAPDVLDEMSEVNSCKAPLYEQETNSTGSDQLS